MSAIAISNIAWNPALDREVSQVLLQTGVTLLESAPTKRWAAPLEATETEIREYRMSWEDRGFQFYAMQALLFGRPDLRLFAEPESRLQMAEFLKGIIRLASALGIRPLVFGSPKSRKAGSMEPERAFTIAAAFFREIGQYAADFGCAVCIEPNPREYDCDFVNTLAEAAALARAADTTGCRVQLDVSSLILNGEPVEASIEGAFEQIGHVHVSEPYLNEPGLHLDAHRKVAATLRRLRWTGPVSIEMRESEADVTGAIRRAAAFTRSVYGDVA